MPHRYQRGEKAIIPRGDHLATVATVLEILPKGKLYVKHNATRCEGVISSEEINFISRKYRLLEPDEIIALGDMIFIAGRWHRSYYTGSPVGWYVIRRLRETAYDHIPYR